MIGLVLLLLLPTPTIWFSLDHKRNVSDRVVSGIGTLFSLDHKLDASLITTLTPTPSLVKTSLKSAYDVVKIKNRSCKRSHKRDGIGVRRIKTFPFSSDSAYDSGRLRSAYDLVKTRLSESEAEAEG